MNQGRGNLLELVEMVKNDMRDGEARWVKGADQGNIISIPSGEWGRE